MHKVLFGAIALMVVLLTLSAGAGILYGHYIYNKYMPEGIVYEIQVNENVWPDRYFASSYGRPMVRSFSLNGYWTFEPGPSFFSGPLWVYHPNELTVEEVNYAVIQIG